jgi:hypothetical protein
MDIEADGVDLYITVQACETIRKLQPGLLLNNDMIGEL